MEIEFIYRVIVGIVIGIQTYWDIKRKEIPSLVSVVGGGIGIVFCFVLERSGTDVILSLMPGAFCLLYGGLTREAIGFGDGILLCVMGLFYDVEHLLWICMSAWIFVGMVALWLLLIVHKKRDYTIPFVPFLLLGWSLEILLHMGG